METLNLKEAAELLNMHRESVRRLVVQGKLPGAKPGKSWVFIEEDLVGWLRSHYYHRWQASQGEGGISCHLHDAERAASGGFALQPLTDAEYAKALKLPTENRQKSTKRN